MLELLLDNSCFTYSQVPLHSLQTDAERIFAEWQFRGHLASSIARLFRDDSSDRESLLRRSWSQL
jgi:hypothetical protein